MFQFVNIYFCCDLCLWLVNWNSVSQLSQSQAEVAATVDTKLKQQMMCLFSLQICKELILINKFGVLQHPPTQIIQLLYYKWATKKCKKEGRIARASVKPMLLTVHEDSGWICHHIHLSLLCSVAQHTIRLHALAFLSGARNPAWNQSFSSTPAIASPPLSACFLKLKTPNMREPASMHKDDKISTFQFPVPPPPVLHWQA